LQRSRVDALIDDSDRAVWIAGARRGITLERRESTLPFREAAARDAQRVAALAALFVPYPDPKHRAFCEMFSMLLAW
jgi:hypothetical protein